jgi:hypothetical protein
VVALEVVVGVRLPVAGQIVPRLVRRHQLFDRVGLALVREGSQRLEQRRGCAIQIEVDEDETTPRIDRGTRERYLGGVETVGRAEVTRGTEPAVEPVGPAVIPAHQARHPATAGMDEGAGPVPAHVLVGPQLAVVVDHHHQRPSRDVTREVVARLRQRVAVADEQPLTSEHGPALLLPDRRIHVPRRRQRERGHARAARLR